MFLAGDLGGTKKILCEFEATADGLSCVRREVYPSQDYRSFDAILADFLARRGGGGTVPLAACFGVAGTVVHGQCRTTNLPWVLDEAELSRALGAPRVKLLNDLEATAYGMLSLPAEETAVVQAGNAASPSRAGNIAVIAAGTGLGEAMLHWDGSLYHPIASEGGHADFGPRTERGVGLWRFLKARYGGHVSYERVLSGPGFYNIYEYLRDEEHLPEPAWMADEVGDGDPNPVISKHGLAGDDPLCAETVAMFASVYGAEAGNLALRCVAVGGVFLGGGIAPKMLPALRSQAFLDSFCDKGRFKPFLERVEVRVSLNPETALLGAAHYAARLGKLGRTPDA
jgi:glucokinase